MSPFFLINYKLFVSFGTYWWQARSGRYSAGSRTLHTDAHFPITNYKKKKKIFVCFASFFPLVSAIWPIFERKRGRCLILKLVMTRLLNQRIWSDTGQAIINFSHCFAYHCTFLVNSVFALDLPVFNKYLVYSMTHLQTLFSTDICFYLFIRWLGNRRFAFKTTNKWTQHTTSE